MSWISKLWPFRRAAAQSDFGNVPLLDAYTALTSRERGYMMGRLRDNAKGIQKRVTPVNTRWQPRHRDEILQDCETGLFLRLGLLLDAMMSDGLISGLLETRTAGMMRRPCTFSGDPWLVEKLKGREANRDSAGCVIEPEEPGIFKRLCPTAEFTKILRDGILAIGIGENVADASGLPSVRHLDLHWLRLEYLPERLVYQSPAATYEIVPGDGRWVVFAPKGLNRWWMSGKWFPLAWPFISRAGTDLDRLRWQGQLADALKAIRTPPSTTDRMRDKLLSFIRREWHRSPAFVGGAGEEAYLVESNGRGYDVYNDAERSAGERIQYTLSGNLVTGAGNKGFSDGDGFFDVAETLNQETAESAAECVQRDILAPWAKRFYGITDPLAVRIAWDVRSPSAQKAAFEAVSLASDTVAKIDAMASARGQEVDLEAFEDEYRISLPLRPKGGVAPCESPPQFPPAVAVGQEQYAPDSHVGHSSQELAQQMTEHGLTSCEHGRSNRCPLCGVERERGVIPGINGADPTWRLAWRPISRGTVG